MKKYLTGLNEEQMQAVENLGGPCMVLAGPGTGKTTILTSRICNMLEKAVVKPENILVVTFSKAAAEEMKHRFRTLAEASGLRNFDKVSFGTFHSIFFRILQQYNGYKLDNLIDEVQKFNIIKTIVRKLELDFFEEEEQISELISDIGYFMNTMSDIQDYNPEVCRKEQFNAILENYLSYKHKHRKFDYDDMLVDCYYLLRDDKSILEAVKNKYKHILIDEFQDINKVQYETIKLIAYPLNNIFIVGDDDQSIYGFRGADPEIMQSFEKEHNNCVKIFMKYNYRTTDKILSYATSVIDNNTCRYDKNLKAIQPEGDVPVMVQPEDFEEEARMITDIIRKKKEQGFQYSEMAAIYRTNIQSRALIDAFMDVNIPFIAVDGAASIYNHWIFKDILSYINLSMDINNRNDVIRIINKPKRFISRASMEKASLLNGNILDKLVTEVGLNNLQIGALEELRININRLKDMTPAKAVRFIRTAIGYDDYILEYAANKGINAAGLYEILDEAESSSANFDSLHQFNAYIREIDAKLSDKSNAYSRENKVHLLTMHRAKGLEYPITFICGAVEGLAPCIREGAENIKSIEEERRLFYVAMTRAKKELYIYSPRNRYKKRVQKSRFLDETFNVQKYCSQNINIGQKVYHKIFHEGVISEVIEANGSKRIIADFSGLKKELDISTCIKNDIIRLIKTN